MHNKQNKKQVLADNKGDFKILAQLGDTLTFSYVGYTDEFRICDGTKLRIILMNKNVNCLGAEWSKHDYNKAFKLIDKRYKELYQKSEELKLWD